MKITAKVVRERRYRLSRATSNLITLSRDLQATGPAWHVTNLLDAAVEYANALRAVEGR